MNEESIVQIVDDEKACAVVIGGNCEDEKPQKECGNVVVAGGKYQYERQKEATNAADTDEDGYCLSSPPPLLPSANSCNLHNRATVLGDNNKHNDERKEEDEATNEGEQWPPPSLPLEIVDDNTANNKNENEGGRSEDVVEQDERSNAQNYDQHPSPHQTTNEIIEAGESRWTRPMGPGGIPLPVETSSLGQQMHQFEMFHHSHMCEKNQAHSESPSFSSAGDCDTGRLGSILDKIDGSASSRWYKVPDPQGNGDYYVDAISCHTQWDQPSNYDESLEESAIATAAARVGVAVPSTILPTLPHDASKYIDYSQSAMFNSKSGHFGGRVENGDYWQRVGLGSDRETRQMSHYFDVSKLNENRKEAERKRQRLNQRGNGIDWKAYADEKKNERVKRRNAWMYEKD